MSTKHEDAAAAAPVDDLAERIERMNREREAEEKAEKRRELELDLEEHELSKRFTRELGPRGVDFEIIKSRADGCIVIKRGEEVLYKRFMSVVQSTKGATNEDYYQYVATSIVHPEKASFDKIVTLRPHVSQRCANAQLTLHGMKESEAKGKF